jgi:hypothetical protein
MHNFIKKVAILTAQGKFSPGIQDVDIKRDDWCAFLNDSRKECNCDPSPGTPRPPECLPYLLELEQLEEVNGRNSL